MFVHFASGVIRIMPTDTIQIYSRRGQEVIMVLYALRQLASMHSKEEVLRFIRENRFYNLEEEDMGHYDGKNEWKSDTLLCYARKDAVENEWMFDHDEKDSWQLARPGQEALDRVMARFCAKQSEVHRCFLWCPEFKRIIDPSHAPSDRDWVRPRSSHEQKMNFFREL